jgi:preprotein translocase subunit SecD
MTQSYRWRTVLVFTVFAMAALWVLPNVVKVPDNWIFSKKKLNYGLDIQGGVHLVMGVDTDGVLRESAKRVASTMGEALKSEGAEVTKAEVVQDTNPPQLEVLAGGATDGAKLKAAIEKRFENVLQVLTTEDKRVVVAYYDNYLNDLRNRIVEQAIETIRNRIDEFGVAEPSITAQGSNRILVQLPGAADANSAKDLINRTARLEFMMVEESVAPDQLVSWISEAEKAGGYDITKLRYSQYVDRVNADLKTKLPKDTMVLFGKNDAAATIEVGKEPYVVRTDTGLGGEALRDAFVGLDEYGKPEVKFSMEPVGAKKFADLTGANKGRRMALVLDKVVKSAPVIQGQIPNGEGRITLGAGRDMQKTMDEAKLISMALRAGALPAALEQLEERTVGPTLGADSIQKGAQAAVIGSLLVFLFMAVFYKGFGLIAVLAMMFNLLITFAILTSLGATLTLPGVAGIALTVGMAVDANVIIFERIKEELRKGVGLKSAVREGFDKAFSAIFDSNITTIATCLVLMYFGTGPIRGFAVTLTAGLGASMFTAVFFSRLMAEWLTHKLNLKLSI